MSTESHRIFEENGRFFQSLHTLQEATLSKETKPNKWSIREIIGHIYYWDKFIMDVMVPEMSKGASLPEFPDHDSYNEKAMGYITKFASTNELIDEMAITREQLLQKLEALPNDTTFEIGKGKRLYTPEKFLAMFVKHDNHHIKQIDAFLKH